MITFHVSNYFTHKLHSHVHPRHSIPMTQGQWPCGVELALLECWAYVIILQQRATYASTGFAGRVTPEMTSGMTVICHCQPGMQCSTTKVKM